MVNRVWRWLNTIKEIWHFVKKQLQTFLQDLKILEQKAAMEMAICYLYECANFTR